MLNFDDVSLPTVPDLEAYAHEVSIDAKQMQLFDLLEKQKFIDTLMLELRKDGYLNDRNKRAVKEKALRLFDEAKHFNIQTQAGMYYYIFLALLLSKPIEQSRYYTQLLNLKEEEEKITLLKKEIRQILEQRRIKHGQA